MTCDCEHAGRKVGVKEVSQENQISRSTLTGFCIVLRHRDLFSETYCGGYSGEDPPLPIPNREVKLTIADGTAPPGGRVGSCHALTKSFETQVSELFLCVSACPNPLGLTSETPQGVSRPYPGRSLGDLSVSNSFVRCSVWFRATGSVVSQSAE